MNRISIRAWSVFLFIAVLLGGFGFFLSEYFTKGSQWVVEASSPHIYDLVETIDEGKTINCCTVVDRDNTLLADLNDGRVYSNMEALRRATVHWVGDRAGNITAHALSYYAKELSGFDYFNGVYNYGQTGGVAELTLSAKIQTAALEAMGDYQGTVAVYNYKTGELLCAVTTPTFDPDNVPDFNKDDPKYEGLYWNRFTQAAYTPGSIFKIATLAAALEHNPDVLNKIFVCEGTLHVGTDKIVCEAGSHGAQSLKEAFCNSCNCAFAQIAMDLGGDVLQSYVEKFGIVDEVSFDGIATEKGNFQSAGAEPLNVAWSGVGQYLDWVNPCAFLRFVGTVANGGKVTQPYLVNRISVDGKTTYQATVQAGEQIISENTAKVLQEYMLNNVSVKYDENKVNFPGLTVGAKTGTAEVEGQKPNAMLAGFVDDEKMPLAFLVCVEDAGYGKEVCVPIASKVLAAAKAHG